MLKVKNLPASPPPGVMLHCNNCLEEYSASRGDYFQMDPEEVPLCGGCDHELQLVEKFTSYRPWSPSIMKRAASYKAKEKP